LEPFKLPPNAETYIHEVKDRSFELIQLGIWKGIASLDVKTWFNNFTDITEKYFAACILDSFIYRSSDQTVALARDLFLKDLPTVLNKTGFNFKNYRELTDDLKSGTDPNLRLVSVITPHQSPTKSSHTILRLLRRKLGFKEAWMIAPSDIEMEIKNGIETFIFIDDFLGTGTQFHSMYKNNLSLKCKAVNLFYAPLVAHQEGIEFIEKECSGVNVVFAEFLNEHADVFSYAFEDSINSPDSARKFYNQLMNKNDFSLLEENKYGVGNLALTYAFEHSSPDNSLNIIWDNKNGWHPLSPK